MDNATRESLTRAEELVRSWRPRPLGIGEDQFADEARAVLEAVTPDQGYEPLLHLLRVPDDELGKEVADEVVGAIAERPDCVEPLLRVIAAGNADAAERRDAVAADRALHALGAMDLDELIRALLDVASGDAETALREEAFNQLVKEGPNVVPALERLGADPLLGPAATRCLEKLEEYDILPGYGDADATGTIGDLIYAYEEAETDEDASYALVQLGELLQDYDWAVGAKALKPARTYVGKVVDAFMSASDAEEEQSALDELEYFAAGCGSPGARLVREAVDDLPVAPGTQRLHDIAEVIATATDAPEPAALSIADAAAGLPVAELQALTARLSFRRIRGVLLDVMNRRDFLAWERPAALPPLDDEDPHEGLIHLALAALCNDADDELKAIAALALLGDREAVPLLRCLVDDPVGGEWVSRVIGWDEDLAAEDGVDLDAWAAAHEPEGGGGPMIDELFAEPAPGVDVEDANVEGAVEQAGETTEPTEAAEASAEATEPMEPPGMASLDEALEEFVRRAEAEPDADAATTAEREPGG